MERTMINWLITEDRMEARVIKYNEPNRPMAPETTNWNSYIHPIDVDKLPMGFWERVGLRAIWRVFNTKASAMDRWCFWRALSDLDKRKLILMARQLRFRCSSCGQSYS